MKRWRQPLDVGVRLLAATVGGYGLTLLTARAIAGQLPLDGSEAAITGSLAAWIVFLAVAIWAFAARNLVHVLVPLIGVAAVLLAITP